MAPSMPGGPIVTDVVIHVIDDILFNFRNNFDAFTLYIKVDNVEQILVYHTIHVGGELCAQTPVQRIESKTNLKTEAFPLKHRFIWPRFSDLSEYFKLIGPRRISCLNSIGRLSRDGGSYV